MNKSNQHHSPELKSRSVDPTPATATNLKYPAAGMDKTLSLIVPVYNVPNIHENLTIVDQELSKTGLGYEIIAINDGSDAITTTRLNSLNLPRLKTFIYAQNQGKGFALRYGFEQTSGDLVGFMDADLQLHPQQIAVFTSLITLVDADIVIGSKRHPLSQIEYSPRRRLYSWGYQQLIRLLFNLNIADTQVGLKLFKRQVLEAVIPRMVVKKWACDLEILAVASHLGFKRILEAPVKLTWGTNTSNVEWKVIPGILQDTFAIFYRKHIIRSYNRQPSTPTLESISALSNETTKETKKINQPSLISTLIEEPPLEKPEPLSSGIIFSAE